MKRRSQIILGIAIAVTFATIALWQATGGDYYTKFRIVEEVEKEVAQDDPLAEAGFYEDTQPTETVVRDDFRFGLLPTPNKLIDKHLLSVASITMPTWIAAFVILWFVRRRDKRASV